MWAIQYDRKESYAQSKGVIALAIEENSIEATLNKCVSKLKQNLRKKYQWLDAEPTSLTEEKVSDRHLTLSLDLRNCRQIYTYSFEAIPLTQGDSAHMHSDLDADEINSYLSHLGFESEINNLRGKNISSPELWALFFLQFTNSENWRLLVHEKLVSMSLRV
jgi:hypothetical protein